MSRPPHSAGADNPAIRNCPKMKAAAAKRVEECAAQQAVADATSLAHPECSRVYREKLEAAEQRDRARVASARADCTTAHKAALDTYQRVDPAMQDNETNRAYGEAVADADKACAKTVAESVRMAGLERAAAYAEYRQSGGYMGEAAP